MTTTTDTLHGVFQRTQERFRVLDTTAITFTKSRATQAAASLAYYTFFSIFPLMLLIILGGSYFLDRQSILQRVTQAVQSALPISQQFIVQNLQQVLKQRTAIGIFVLVSLLWSASGMFNNLAYEINKAWPEAKDRGFVQSRLIGIDLVFGLIGLLILSVVLDSLTKWLGGAASANGPFSGFNPLSVVSSLGSWIAIFLLYLAMYRWIPTIRVAWSASIWGAIAAALGWKAATTGFAWYLSSPFARYQLVYGSLGAIVAFLFLIYIIALVTLFGAHLTAAIDHLHEQHHATQPAPKSDKMDVNPDNRSDTRAKSQSERASGDAAWTAAVPVTRQAKNSEKPADEEAPSDAEEDSSS